MIYMNKVLFKPALIIWSVAWVPLIILLTSLCVKSPEPQLFVITGALVLFYALAVFLLYKDCMTKKYYMKAEEDDLKICCPGLEKDNKTLLIKIQDIDHFEYQKGCAFVSFLGVLPLIQYVQDGKVCRRYLCNTKKAELEEFCETYKIKLIPN